MNTGEKINITLNKFCILVFDGTHDSPKYVESGYPLITSKNLDVNINIEKAPLISKNDFDKINKRSKVQKNDILISLIGTVGMISYIKNEPNFAIKNVGVLRAHTLFDAKYLYYYLQSNKAQSDIKSSLVGSTQPFLSLNSLRNFIVYVPKSEEYKEYIVNTISFLLLKSL